MRLIGFCQDDYVVCKSFFFCIIFSMYFFQLVNMRIIKVRVSTKEILEKICSYWWNASRPR